MLFAFAFVLMGVVFIMQLLLCLKAKRLWSKLLPLILVALGELACIGTYWVSMHMEQAGKHAFGTVFAAVIYGILMVYLLAADAAAWAVSAIVRFVQKRKK